MLLSMHVHFLIITYIHISCIFSELISQYTSVRMIQFFYILIYSIHMKVYCYCQISNCYCLNLNCYCPISNCYCLTLNCYCLTLNCYCLTFPTVTVWLFQPLLSDFELLLFDFSNRYCLTFPTVTIWLFIQIRLPLPFTQYFHKLHTTHMN